MCDILYNVLKLDDTSTCINFFLTPLKFMVNLRKNEVFS